MMRKFGSPEPIAPDEQHSKQASQTEWSDKDRADLAQENKQTDEE